MLSEKDCGICTRPETKKRLCGECITAEHKINKHTMVYEADGSIGWESLMLGVWCRKKKEKDELVDKEKDEHE